MSKTKQEHPDPAEAEVAAAWTVLFQPKEVPSDEAFMTRCDGVAKAGVSLLQLRAECARRGFLALPLDVYLADACAAAGASLQALWAKASESPRNVWATLANWAGMPLAHIQLMLRFWFLSQDRLIRARGASTSGDATFSLPSAEITPGELEAQLTTVEAGYSESRRKRLEQLLTEAGA